MSWWLSSVFLQQEGEEPWQKLWQTWALAVPQLCAEGSGYLPGGGGVDSAEPVAFKLLDEEWRGLLQLERLEGQWVLICKGTEPNAAVWLGVNCRIWKGTSETSPQITAFPDLLLSGCLPLKWPLMLAASLNTVLWAVPLEQKWAGFHLPWAGHHLAELPHLGCFVLFLHFVRLDSPISDWCCWF